MSDTNSDTYGMDKMAAPPSSMSLFSQVRTGKSTPDAYRLAKKSDGTLVLQGAFNWYEGPKRGSKWQDMETVDLTNGETNDA